MLTATYKFNKRIATATIRFIVTVAIVVYKGLILVVYRMLTLKLFLKKKLLVLIKKQAVSTYLKPLFAGLCMYLHVYYI